jgi:hypothetical protein
LVVLPHRRHGAGLGGVTFDQGVNFLSKPFTLDQRVAKVRAVLDASTGAGPGDDMQ